MQDLKETSAYRQALREHIKEVAMKAFIAHGVRAVKMDDIAKLLGISKRTLYEIYSDKEELLHHCISHYDRQKQESLREYAQDHHVIDVILEAYHRKAQETRSFSPVFYEDIMRYPKVAQYIKEERERVRDYFGLFMQRGVSEGLFRAELNYDIVTRLFDAIGDHIMNTQITRQYALEDLFVNMFLVSLRGMCTDKGVRTIDEAIAKIR